MPAIVQVRDLHKSFTRGSEAIHVLRDLTLDVGEVTDGLRVVETNCFHSSGFYACDARAIARAVTAWVVREG